MKVRVQFFAQLRDVTGVPELDMNVNANATIADLLAALYKQTPSLQEWDENILVGVGLEFVRRDYILQPNEEIAIMPPVQGG